jgi:hypothetical protein
VSEALSGHAREPWSWDVEEGGYEVRTADDKLVAQLWDSHDARRVVACVNACEAISTEALETGVVAELVEALKRFIEEMLTWNSTMGPYERPRGEVCPELEALYARVKP